MTDDNDTTVANAAADAPDIVADASEIIRGYLASVDLEWEDGTRDGEFVVTLPGEKKLKTVVSLMVTAERISVSAFVIRHPDENHEAFYRFLLSKNLRMPGVAYAVDGDGDVFVRADQPTAGVTAERLDELFGVILEAADHRFNDLLVLGFLTSMRKEWDWRISRGEPTRNLEAFRHLLES